MDEEYWRLHYGVEPWGPMPRRMIAVDDEVDDFPDECAGEYDPIEDEVDDAMARFRDA